MVIIKKYFKNFLVIFFLLTSVCFFVLWINSGTHTNIKKEVGQFHFINPTLLSGVDKHFIVNFQPLRTQFEQIQKKYSQKTYVYFAYLNNAAWIGLNERETFVAASTIKVPLAMAIYKAIEDGKLNKDDTYTIEESDLDDNFGSLYKKGSGFDISIEELVGYMLRESDNTAMNALMRVLERIGISNPFEKVYIAMGWDSFPSMGEVEQYKLMHVKILSNMFLSLYNATYINIEHSDKILSLLSETPFNEKIKVGTPKDVLVSHKVGISGDNKTYADCGIVFAPQRHYILCIASNGEDEKNADQFMGEISKAAYNYVINN